MKLASRKKDRWIYSIDEDEKSFMQDMLDLYPQVPDSHHQLVKSGVSDSCSEQQRLLEESMREHRLENKLKLQRILSQEGRFARNDEGFLLEVTSEQRETLLQLFNDIRVGFWLQLGSPEDEEKMKLFEDARNVPKLLAMDFCAAFQMMLLSGN